MLQITPAMGHRTLTQMLCFPMRFPARLTCRTEFSRHAFANLSFFDHPDGAIPFHISLRQPAGPDAPGLVVFNHRGTESHDWHPEVHHHVPFSRFPLLDIHFDAKHLLVRIDGQEVARFGGLWRKLPFPRLSEIAYLEVQGGVIPGSIDIDTPYSGPQSAQFDLDARLDLRGPLTTANSVTDLQLTVPTLGTPLPVIPSADGTRFHAPLPGRAWQGVANKTPLQLTLQDGNRVLHTLSLTPRDILDRTQALLQHDLSGDPELVTRILEHTRFADVLDQLAPQAQSRLISLANGLGLDSFLHANRADAIIDAPPPDTDTDPLIDALAEVGLQLRALPDDADLTPVAQALTPPQRPEARYFYVALAEPFCLRNQFDALFQRAQDDGITTADGGLAPVSEDVWFNSGLMPFLLRKGASRTLLAVMTQLIENTDGWIMTPPVGWTISQLMQGAPVPEHTRTGVLQGFLAFLRRRAPDYWERTNCIALIDATLDMLEHRASLPSPLHPDPNRDLAGTIVQVYGLSRPFWQRLAARGLTDLPPLVQTAREAFEVLNDPLAAPAAQEAGLTLFETRYNPDTARVRRDIFGPIGIASPPKGTVLAKTQLDVGEASLRHMAAPGSPALDPTLRHEARQALDRCTPSIPSTRLALVQEAATRRAAAILTQLHTGQDPMTELDKLLPDLGRLSGKRTGHLGLGLGLSLLHGLHSAPAQPSVWEAVQRLEQAITDLVTLLTAEDTDPFPAPPATLLPDEISEAEPPTSLTDLARAPALAQPLRHLTSRSDSPLAPLLAAAPPQPTPDTPAGLDPAHPLFDTIVTVFSCRPNLDSRIPQLRQAWLAQLSALGVPYVIVTGDGDDTLNGDVLALDAPDDYEGLPQKTLATIDWVHRQTGYGHMFKIDDDCFLNADAFFHTLTYRKFDYYGRTLTRGAGQMDRAWHIMKSHSERGRLELDKSPEPSTYCDGGSGYVLSRTAMGAVLEAAASPEGRALIQVSFMEDKLTGDLLALRGIRPENEGYRIAVRRRPARNHMTVSRWENSFFPSQANPVPLIHLDDEKAQAPTQQGLNSSELHPKKLWPSYQPVRLGADSNALEMITPANRLEAARSAPVAVIACMRNEMFMLPAFLAHYRRLGVESFVIADNCSDDGTLEYLAEQPDVALFSVDTAYRNSRYGVAWQQALMANLRPGMWSLVADADELLVWQRERGETLPQLLAQPAFEAADAARIFMLDLYPQGSLSEATFASGNPFSEAGFTDRIPFLETSYGRGPYSDSSTWTSAVRHRLIPGSRAELFVAQKMALLKYSPFMRLSAGLHYVSGCRPAQRELLFGHFKYNADFRRKAQAEVARRQHFNNAEEYRKYLALVSEGRDVVFDPEVSVPWQECDFVRTRLN
jgi:Glycosyl transferase family 2/Galactosyltransferase